MRARQSDLAVRHQSIPPMDSSFFLLPSILTADFGNLEKDIARAVDAGVDGIHLDVMDGRFVPNLTFGASVVASVRKMTALKLDVHLMVEEPLRLIPDFAAAGADVITVHVEACRDLYRVLDTIRGFELEAGVALNPGTACEAVREVLAMADRVLIMSVPPGFGGASFIPTTPAKLARMRSLIMAESDGTRPVMQVDGGVDVSNVHKVVAAGARHVVAGSSVFNDRASVKTNVEALRRASRQPQGH